MITDLMSFNGRAVLVAGAGGGGIGSATCIALAEAGARVIAVDISEQALDQLGEKLAPTGVHLDRHVLDVRDTQSVDALFRELDESVGPAPHLVNVIGGVRPQDWGPLEDCSDESLEQVFDFNLACAFRLGRRVAQRLIAADMTGSIVNVSSINALFASEQASLYSVAKAALDGMTRSMAVNWGRYGIRCNSVAPGRVDTPVIMERVRRGEIPPSESYAGRIPLRRAANSDDIAAPIVFLLSDLARYVTGQSLLVDGGASVRFMIAPDSETLAALGNQRGA